MDLLSQIITRKKQSHTKYLPQVRTLLEELIVYEKLSTNKRFQNLDHPVIQKKCPNLVRIKQTDSFEFALFSELKPLLISFTNRNFIGLDLPQISKKEQILIGAYNLSFQVLDLVRLTEKPEEYITLTENNKIMVFTDSSEGIVIYTGEYGKSQSYDTKVAPIVIEKNGHNIVLESFSRRGANDYQFAIIDNKPVRIEQDTLLVGNSHIHLTPGWLSGLLFDENKQKEYEIGRFERKVASYLLDEYIQNLEVGV